MATSGDSYHTKIKEDTLNTCSNIILLSITWGSFRECLQEADWFDLVLWSHHLWNAFLSSKMRFWMQKPGSMFRGDDRTCGRHSPQLLMRCWKGAGHNPLCSGLAYFAILYFHLLLDGQSVPGRASKCQSAFSLLCTCKTKPGHFLKETENECIIFTFRKFSLLKVTWYSCRIKVDYLD